MAGRSATCSSGKMQLVVVQLQTMRVITYRAPGPGPDCPREVGTDLLDAVRVTSTYAHGTQCKDPQVVATGDNEVPRCGWYVTNNRTGNGICKGPRGLIAEVLNRGVVAGKARYVPLSGGTVS